MLVPKKDGSTRFCVDLRRLTDITKKDVNPLPRIEDILDTLGRAQYFTTLDLSAGHWQISLDQSAKEKTAFTTHCGLFEINGILFGLCSAHSTFQRLMQTVLTGLEGKTCFVYSALNFPTPTDLNKLQQFLGLGLYYRRFIRNFAAVAAPLNALKKKNTPFEWTVKCQEAFGRLKQLLCSAPVLAYPQFGPGQQFVLEMDASLAG